ncbi:MAG: serine/threonine protein kinase [Anaerolineales bacterium]|nr:serine/threonine protein kinase [Anaerolineales bacterium]
MGEVYKAYDPLRDEIVALKVIRDDILKKQADKAKRSFLAEAIAGARLGKECIHIVNVYDIGQFEDIFYMAQEWIPGGDIVELCGAITLFKARTIIMQIGNAVQSAARNGIVHSDIAPANILHDNRRDIYKLSDFGLLKLMSKTSISISGSSSLMTGGRRDFMPKEHFDAPATINHSTDVYALAVTLYVLTTGELLPRDGGGKYIIPGTIAVKGEKGRPAPFKINSLLDEFLVRRRDEHTIDSFLERVSSVPA